MNGGKDAAVINRWNCVVPVTKAVKRRGGVDGHAVIKTDIGDDLSAKLAAVGLVPEWGSALLADFLDGYITRRTDIKPRTQLNLEV